MKKIFFQNLELVVFDSVYEPSEDSFLLANSLPKISGKTVLDLGCGTGIQGINASQKGAKSILSVDVNKKALENVLENCKNLGIKNISVRESNLFEQIREKFDIIVFNPPYLPSEEIEVPELDGGKDGIELTEKFISQAGKHLNSKGICFLLVSSLNDFSKVEKLINQAGFKFEILGQEKFFFEELRIYKFSKAL
ncbi:MAG: methyltransferase [Candidatus Diapherotrites archaeon]|nr:methyltransferase [Candidatus Diapherotrites archaeon]